MLFIRTGKGRAKFYGLEGNVFVLTREHIILESITWMQTKQMNESQLTVTSQLLRTKLIV